MNQGLIMQKLINSVQNYARGSKTALTDLYGIANPDNLPMAELWMGAHPKSSSKIEDASGQVRSLRDVIDADKAALLGDKVANRFGELPFLFKVLCADQPLSIQVHPNKKASELGFAKENAAGIPLDAAERNYKDPNHKPELVFALTPFTAMNAFREFSRSSPCCNRSPGLTTRSPTSRKPERRSLERAVCQPAEYAGRGKIPRAGGAESRAEQPAG